MTTASVPLKGGTEAVLLCSIKRFSSFAEFIHAAMKGKGYWQAESGLMIDVFVQALQQARGEQAESLNEESR